MAVRVPVFASLAPGCCYKGNRRNVSGICRSEFRGEVCRQAARPTDAVFRTNHASNYLAIAGRLPHDRAKIVGTIDAAIAGEVVLRPEWARGL